MKFKIILQGNVPSKKNNKNITASKHTGKLLLVSSERFKQWESDQLKELRCLQIPALKPPYQALVVFYPSTKRKSDCSNKFESIADLFVDAGLIEDDNWFVLSDSRMVFGGVDKHHPRAEIYIRSETDCLTDVKTITESFLSGTNY